MILRPLPCYCAACVNLRGIEHCDCTVVDCPACACCRIHCDCWSWANEERAERPAEPGKAVAEGRRRPGNCPDHSQRRRRQAEERMRRETAAFMEEYKAYLAGVLGRAPQGPA